MPTTVSPELFILDVGHGNCAILRTAEGAVVIDAPSDPVVAKMLDELEIENITNLIVSHADSDHLSGAISILMDERRSVQSVHVNPDKRNAATWYRFRAAVRDASRRGTRVHAVLNSQDPGTIALQDVDVSVLHPLSWDCLATVDGVDLDGVQQNPNSMSGVVLVKYQGEPVCLLAGDAERSSLTSMLTEGADLRASVLVFPHHGGHSGRGRGAEQRKANQDFAKSLTQAVAPEYVLFSLGRAKHRNPQTEIVNGIRGAADQVGAAAHIACTQLSVNCAAHLPGVSRENLDRRSSGEKNNFCCAGTVVVPLDPHIRARLMGRFRRSHEEFVSQHVKGSLCKRALDHA